MEYLAFRINLFHLATGVDISVKMKANDIFEKGYAGRAESEKEKLALR